MASDNHTDSGTLRERLLAARCEVLERQKNGAYSERNQLVAALSKMFPASLERHPEEDKAWDDDWRWIVFIDLPTGQASWHIHDSELAMFDHLPRHIGRTWDGHTTDEKYARLASMTPMPEMHPATLDLVRRFAFALAEKLGKAEIKYGYSDGWASNGWESECRAKLMEHVLKGDPRDVAAYCAFMWHHGWRTWLPSHAAWAALEAMERAMPCTCGSAPCPHSVGAAGAGSNGAAGAGGGGSPVLSGTAILMGLNERLAKGGRGDDLPTCRNCNRLLAHCTCLEPDED